MTPDAVARRWFKEVWNDGDESAIDRLMHPDAVAHGLTGEAIRGREGFKGLFRTFRTALGDMRIDVERTVVEGDTCAALCHVLGNHVGHSFGGAPSGNAVDFYGMTIFRIKDDQLIEGWNCFDFLSMYQQIGWVKAPVVP